MPPREWSMAKAQFAVIGEPSSRPRRRDVQPTTRITESPDQGMADTMAAFSDAGAFEKFSLEVSARMRYLRSAGSENFLAAVASTCQRRLKTIPGNVTFWRAQIGHEWVVDTEQGTRLRGPHPKSRMKPLQDRAYEGRVNSKGIPCLYFATTRDVAMAEVRPWIGSVISVGRFETVRPLRVVDCSLLTDRKMFKDTLPKAISVESSVWEGINRAFSRPVTRSDNTAEYAATQVLAEVFRREGHDGILYKSAFGVDGYNIALFDLDCAHQIDSSLFVVEDAAFTFRQIN